MAVRQSVSQSGSQSVRQPISPLRYKLLSHYYKYDVQSFHAGLCSDRDIVACEAVYLDPDVSESSATSIFTVAMADLLRFIEPVNSDRRTVSTT
jgi:hypothetical protein